MSSSIITNNTAGVAGGIYASDTILYLENITIANCTALSGGALFLTGLTNGTICNTKILDNQSEENGGGVVISGESTIHLDEIEFTGNSGLSGGALSVSGKAAPNITHCYFSLCSGSVSGGAIQVGSNSTSSFYHCEISNNYAYSSGSGFISVDFSQTYLYNLTITKNHCPNQGGGMHIDDQSSVTMQQVQFIENSADSTGGALAIIISGHATVLDCIFEDNQCGSSGGAITLTNRATIDITNSTIVNSKANAGAAIYLTDVSVAFIHPGNVFANNTASTRGGAIFATGNATLDMDSSIVENNTASSSTGGGILIQDLVSANFNHSSFIGNTGTEGGALYLDSDISFHVADCTFLDNIATTGGAIYVGGPSTSLWEAIQCSGNFAEGGIGGCAIIQDTATVSFANFSCENNRAKTGGGIGVQDTGKLFLSNSSISKNDAVRGGGLFVGTAASAFITNSIVNRNTASSSGGGVFTSSAKSQITNVSFEQNSAIDGGALLFIYSSNISTALHHCYFIENSARVGGGIYLRGVTTMTTNSTMDTMDLIKATEFQFENISMTNNSAEYGGAIYFDSAHSTTPLFGPSCFLQNNTAFSYGGAVFFGEYNDNQIPVIYGAIFDSNTATFGGATAGFQTISNASSADNFCENCVWPSSFPDPSGYQTTKGFASPPSALAFNSQYGYCPNSISLNSPPLQIIVYLIDDFSTPVTGELILQFPISVSMTNNNPNITIQANGDHFPEESIQYTSGGAYFNDTTFCGPNNSSAELIFRGNLNFSSSLILPVESASCSILLNGCPEGYKVQGPNDQGCDTCQETMNSATITFILLFIIFSLCFLLLFIIIVLALRRYIAQRKQKKKQSLIVPDFIGKPSLTLQDILNDPDIPRLDWESIIIGETIGKGASGLVSRGIWKHNGKENEIAVKELIFGFQMFGPEVLEEFLVEIKYMSVLYHDNIVSFYGIAAPNDFSKLFLVTELMHFGTVRDLLDKKGANLSWKLRLQFAKQAAKGMDYLHSKKLIHRDLKTENLLVNKEWSCKVADFGISTVRPTITREMTCIGTPVYMAPEVLRKNKYSEKADIFSFGILLWEIFTGKRPYAEGEFMDMHQAQLMYAILEEDARPSLLGMDSALQQLIVDCWNIDPKLRPSFSEIVVRLRRLRQPDSYDSFLLHQMSDSVRDSSTEGSILGLSGTATFIN